VDATAPAKPNTPDLVAASDSGSSDMDNITSDTTPALTGTAEANAQVSVYDNAILLGTTTADGSDNWAFTPSTALADGAHTITARATDAAGNLSTASSSLSLTIDTAAPAVTDGNIAISGATGVGGAFKVGDTVTATWNNTAAGDNNNDLASVVVDFSEFGGPSAVAATQTGGVWQASFTITEDGGGIIESANRNVAVMATDTAGNSSTVADTSNATVDNNSPGTPGGILAVDENTAAGTVVGTVSASGTDNSYSLVDNAGGRFAINAGNGQVTVVDGLLLDYEQSSGHTIIVRATDAAGNITDTRLEVAVNDVFDDPPQNLSPTGDSSGRIVSDSPGATGIGPEASPSNGFDSSPWAPPGTLPTPIRDTGDAGTGEFGQPGRAEGY
jgi:hypothetical protein